MKRVRKTYSNNKEEQVCVRPQGPLLPIRWCPHLIKPPPLFADVLYGQHKHCPVSSTVKNNPLNVVTYS